ncbi:molybdenum cofactor biosynthesis protein MoaE [Gluconacetobacter takamatsuzukensis]|uniref:Molybdopterin synthase catalytic subunit n=1 Tax=Gluconacetobacter takamatsuzukensis TaxID=1286190 RepID=A0A7W4KGL7_9PROT|nr:molybdenum cofactor biosynthesis protein MoaE [Gluconacetobacter takamatsuzukensis]MBB2206551.1 molybdenum cofactor biosynthesis protein MoaE [Gluconacetobacter takamatsuzukensis]
MSRFLMADAPVAIGVLQRELLLPQAGGFCSFEGWVRQTNDGRAVSGIDYKAFRPLALTEGQAILEEATARFAICAATAMHRIGYLAVGETAVWIGVAAPHRDAAFGACRFIIDEIKRRVPIWKQEHYEAGETGWVACHDVR